MKIIYEGSKETKLCLASGTIKVFSGTILDLSDDEANRVLNNKCFKEVKSEVKEVIKKKTKKRRTR